MTNAGNMIPVDVSKEDHRAFMRKIPPPFRAGRVRVGLQLASLGQMVSFLGPDWANFSTKFDLAWMQPYLDWSSTKTMDAIMLIVEGCKHTFP